MTEKQPHEDPTLADVLAFIEADDGLPQSRRQHLAWAVRAAADYLGRPLAALSARPAALRFGIARLHHRQLGITKKTLATWRSALLAALRLYRNTTDRPSRGTHLAPAWQQLLDALPERRLRLGLVRFFRYCSARSINPEAVGDALVFEFKASLEAGTFVTNINDIHRRTARLWNEASTNVPNWPTTSLTIPNNRPPKRGLGWGDFEKSFRQDVDAYLETRSPSVDPKDSIDRLLDETRERPWSPATIKLRREQIRLAASAAIHQGVPSERLRSLADLVKPDVAKKALSLYLERDQKTLGRVEPRTFTINLAYSLLNVAKTWAGLDKAEVEQLSKMDKSLARFQQSGLTEKNSTAVRTLMDRVNRDRLLALPEKMVAEAEAMSADYRAAVKAQIAVIVAILTAAPMRVRNLARLRIGIELRRSSGHGSDFHIAIDNHLVKNDVALEYPLPASISRLIERYVETFRPNLVNAQTDWLFPGERGFKDERTIAQQVAETVRREIGIDITPHQFRHAAAAWILEDDPAKIEFVRRVLGHTNVGTTLRYYSGLRDASTVRHYQIRVLPGGQGNLRPTL